MAVKNPTQWSAPSGTGYFSQSSGAALTTLSGSTLTALSGTSLNILSEVYNPKYATSWTVATKDETQWVTGYTVTVGTELFTDNSANFLVTNLGSNIATTTTYTVPKHATAWTVTGV